MKKGLAVFSGSAVVHKLMQDGTVVLGTAANPASVTVSGSLTASADSIEVGNVGGEFVNTTLGGILVELKGAATSATDALSSSLKPYIDAQDVAVGDAAAAALSAYTASNDAALAAEVQARIDGDASVRSDLAAAITASATAASSSLEGVRSDLQGQIDVLAGGDLSGTLSSIAEIQSFLDGQAGGVEGILTGFNDLSIAVNTISGALTQEVADREAAVSGVQSNLDSASGSLAAAIAAGDAAVQANLDSVSSSLASAVAAGDAAVQSNLDSVSGSLAAAIAAGDAAVQANLDTVSGSLAGVIQGNFDLQQSDIDGLRSDVDALTGDLATETAARIAGDEGLQAQIDALQLTSSGDVSALRDDFNAYTASNDSALAAEIARATAAEQLVQSNLDSAVASFSASLSAEVTRAEAAEAGLQSAIDAILSGSDVNLDTFKEVVDFVNSIDLTNDNALLAAVTDINADISTLSGNLVSEISRATAAEAGLAADIATEQARAEAAEAGLQAQIDASAFTVNGMSVNAKSGSFTIVSSSNIDIASAAGVVTVSLKDSVSITGSLSAAQLSASAGLSVAGGATVAGGLTVSTGDMSVSQGAVSTRMTRAQAEARTPQDGDMFYLTDTTDDPDGTFPRGKCWYFRQDGEWFDAPFYMG